ncbi:hypothetical protein AB0H58_16795 [Nocardia neocaledoniensis]|uniref:hypothetical protein n=1 Tax=Nocardia neocaledoniensis TaxID=236511 RepID=UPI0033C7AD8A
MSALEDDRLDLRLVEMSPEEITAARRDTERILGRKFAPFPAEVAAYKKAGLEPPT